MPLISEAAILATRISISILAFASSAWDNPLPNICCGNQDKITPQMAAKAASTQNSVINIPLSVASLSRS